MDESTQQNFLLGFNELCRGTEIPELFAAWTGLAGVSCALGRRCWIDMGTFTIFPNMYICLVGGSGLVRKSTSIGMIEGMLRALEPPPNMIAQKITPEALIDAIRTKEQPVFGTQTTIIPLEKDQIVQKLTIQDRAEGFVLVDELGTFLNKASYEAGLAPLLISLFDCKTNFDYRTKGGGSQKIHNACLGLLGASTVDWITNAIPENAVGGGLTSRFVFVYVSKPADPVPRPVFDEKKKRLKESLQETLNRITMLNGEFKLTEEAWSFYENEYIKFKTSPEGLALFSNRSLSGYASRRAVHQLKLCMLLSASERADLIITLRHIEGATALLVEAEKYMPLVLSLITSNEQGTMMNIIMDAINRTGTLDRISVLRLMSHKLSVREVDTLLDTLIQSNRIVAEVAGAKINYISKEARMK